MAAAARYLGLTQTELRAQKAAGKTLAQIAVAQGKTVAGLKAAMIAAVEKNLDAAVAAGRITAAQKADRLAAMQDRVDALVNGAGRDGLRLPRRPVSCPEPVDGGPLRRASGLLRSFSGRS